MPANLIQQLEKFREIDQHLSNAISKANNIGFQDELKDKFNQMIEFARSLMEIEIGKQVLKSQDHSVETIMYLQKILIKK